MAGDARLIQRNAQLINYGGVAVPYPILAASTALWQDEAHVEAGRERYRANFDLAEAKLGTLWPGAIGQAVEAGFRQVGEEKFLKENYLLRFEKVSAKR